MAILGATGVLCGLGWACNDSGEAPSARDRQVRSQVLRDLISSREKMPDPQQLEAQRKDLQAQVGPSKEVGPRDAGMPPPEGSTQGTVEWVGNDELLVRDTGGVERDVRVEDGTRFVREGREVSRRLVEQGSEVRVAYDVNQGEWVAREVELLRREIRAQPLEAEGTVSQPVPK
jgi:hypothetical protein